MVTARTAAFGASPALRVAVNSINDAWHGPPIHLDVPDGPDWYDAVGLFVGDSAALSELWRRHLAYRPGLALSGTYFVSHVAFALASQPIGLLLSGALVPDLRPAAVSLRFNDRGEATALAVAPEAQIAARTGIAAEEWLYRALLEHLQPLVDVVSSWARRRPRHLWGEVASTVTDAFLGYGSAFGLEDIADRLDRFFAHDQGPMYGLAGSMPVEAAGRRALYKTRSTCCLAFTTDHGYCTSCPLLSGAERWRRAAAHLVRVTSSPSGSL